jgi:hypothetical protein
MRTSSEVNIFIYLSNCPQSHALASKFVEPRPWTLYILQSNIRSAGMESGRLVTKIFQLQTIRNTKYDIPLPQMHHSKQTIAASLTETPQTRPTAHNRPIGSLNMLSTLCTRTTSFKTKTPRSAHRVHLCVLCGAQNEE